MKALGIDPIHDTRETFRALIDAMSRPGTVQTGPTTPMDHAVVSTLVDHEIGFRTDDEELGDALATQGRLTEVPFGVADIVHLRGTSDERLRDVRRGTLKEPSRGGTVVYRVEELNDRMEVETGDDSAMERRGADHQLLELTGPGVSGTRMLGVTGLALPEIEAITDAQSGFPRGIDVMLTTERQVAVLPRSVILEVA